MCNKYTLLARSAVAGILLLGGSISFAAATCATQANPWVSVLIEQNPPPLDSSANMQKFVNEVHTFAPNLQQILLRVTPVDARNYNGLDAKYVELITDLQKAYTNNLEIGFHPDNSKGSYSFWVNKQGVACSAGDYKCVLTESVNFMNKINAGLPKGHGFGIFSVEQSYIEPMDPAGISFVKTYLAANAKGVKYGYVSPSYSPELMGPDKLDYEYPQYYNLYTNRKSGTVPSLPRISKTPQASNFEIMDARPGTEPTNITVLPNFLQPMTSVYEQNDPELAAAYMAYILQNKSKSYPMDSTPTSIGNKVIYITFSGEPEFLGGVAWTPHNICTFQNDLMNKLQSKGIDTSKARFAIWNVNTMLAHVKVTS